MRMRAAGFSGAVLLGMMSCGPVRAEVVMTGTFTATQACPAYQGFRKGTNPGDVKVEPNKGYAVIAKNKPAATHYRIVVEGAEPRERWVELSCGRVDGAGQDAGAASPSAPGAAPPPAGDASGARATHVLAMSWQPAFCKSHTDKSECRDPAAQERYTKNLSLHGLWPQPRGTQYCNVSAGDKAADRNHNWDGLPAPEMSAETLKRLSAVMPGVQSKLERHEWIVHGSCFGANADSYFARAAGLSESVNGSAVSKLFADNAGKTLSGEAIRAAFDEAFGAGSGARVTVSCHGKGERRQITELIISLAGDVTGSAPIGDLMKAAQPVRAGCPSGVVAGK